MKAGDERISFTRPIELRAALISLWQSATVFLDEMTSGRRAIVYLHLTSIEGEDELKIDPEDASRLAELLLKASSRGLSKDEKNDLLSKACEVIMENNSSQE